MNNYADIWTPSHCLSKAQLLGYVRNSLDRDEVYLVESHLNDCELCSEALDGLMQENPEQISQAVADVKLEVEKKIREKFPATQVKKGNPATTVSDKPAPPLKAFQFNTRRWSAAAAIVLIMGLGTYAMYTYIKSHQQQLAQETSLSTPQEGRPAPSATNPQTENSPLVADQSPETTTDQTKTISPQSKIPQAPAPVKESPAVAETRTEDAPMQDDEKSVNDLASGTKDEAAQRPPMESDQAVSESVPAAVARQSEQFNNAQKAVAAEEKVLAKRSKADYGMSNSKPPAMLGNKNLAYPANANNQNVATKELANDETELEEVSYNPFDKGLEYYNQTDYARCIPYFEKALKKSSGERKEDIQFYLAQAYRQTGKERKAQKMFELLSKGSKYRKQAEAEIRTITK